MQSTEPELKTLNCEKHGEYQERSVELLGKWILLSSCSKCSEEEEKKQKEDERLLQEEYQKHRARKKRLDAGISKRYLGTKFESIKPFNKAQDNALKVLIKLANTISSNEHTSSIIITGGVGTGKTMLCCAVIEKLIENKTCQMVKCIDLIRSLKATWNKNSNDSEEEVIDYLTSLDLLIIDEIGVQFGSDTEKMFIFDVIDGRYENMLPTILISNQNIEAIKTIIGERVVDRLRSEGGQLLVLDGDSQRK